MITLSNIKKVFRTEEVDTWALREVSLEVKKGEFVAIMGLLDKPTEGTYTLNGKDVSQLNEKERTKIRKGTIGFVFQSFNLIDDLEVYENVELPLLYMDIPTKERRRRVSDILDRMAMSHRRKHFPCQLSGGQQQRVAIARAVVGEPEIILADEPTGNLDSKNSKEVMDLLCELHRQGTTIVMVTHSQHNASYADRIVNLYDGQIVEQTEL